ncbi:uncharacterized protein lacc1 isoform X3 [Syngnathus acus]|uniref:uncharacterized protein lacc1 isoform X3 n=1 Tax=Syngnathus acus TaxID=161584 RepID=UPI001886353E|nr:uncharacterized protein lacc1 isoform X3 [Syngnathus acus]
MSESAAAVLLDLAHACRCGCTERLFREEAAAATADAHLLVLCAGSARSAVVDASVRAWSGGGGARVLLDWRATAACAYRLKRAADEAGVLWLRVITSPRGRALLLGYERALFTALYKFTYRLGCGPRPLRGADTPVRQVEGDVTVLLQALPAVGGAIRLLTSTLIPECFGHGFSTRAGGVSLVPTLSSLNLFSSPRRRDSAALVNENQRRLALHAGFYPRPLQMLKVEHSSRVWVLGKAEPERYDAAVTDQPGAVLAAPGADCVPMLFADPVAKAAGEERCWASPRQRCRPWRPSWAACAPTSVWSWAPRSGRAASRWSRNRPPASGRTACAVHRRAGPTWTSDWPTGCSCRRRASRRCTSRTTPAWRPARRATRETSSRTCGTEPTLAPRWASCGLRRRRRPSARLPRDACETEAPLWRDRSAALARPKRRLAPSNHLDASSGCSLCRLESR